MKSALIGLLLRVLRLLVVLAEELRAYKDENGHCKVPQKHPQHGKWVNNQRTELKKYKDDESLTGLQRERIDKLDSINFYWGRDNKKKS
ncbi:hypothetical protein ACHAXN_001813 [Cyclotella atomus]